MTVVYIGMKHVTHHKNCFAHDSARNVMSDVPILLCSKVRTKLHFMLRQKVKGACPVGGAGLWQRCAPKGPSEAHLNCLLQVAVWPTNVPKSWRGKAAIKT